MLSRRHFIQSAGMAVASVAIGLRLSHGQPQLAPVEQIYEWSEHSKRLVLSDAAYEEIGQQYAEALARSMAQTRESVAMKIFWDHDYEKMTTQLIPMQELYA